MTTSIIRFLNVILAALLAGTSFGIWIGFNPMNLSPSVYVVQQQNMLRSLNVLMISLVLLATIISLVSAFLQKNDKPALITLLIASVFFIACIIISRFGNQPINNKMMTWIPDSLPADWTELRDQWWSFHIMRTISELIALCLVSWASIRKNFSA
jgi:uncharacterized membrane protein